MFVYVNSSERSALKLNADWLAVLEVAPIWVGSHVRETTVFEALKCRQKPCEEIKVGQAGLLEVHLRPRSA